MNIRLTIFTVLFVCTVLWAMPGTVRGQTPTPTPTPTLQGGSLFASVNLGGTCNTAGGSAIFQYTPQYIPPNGTPNIFASNLHAPRGLAFDSHGNLFVATNTADDSCNIQGAIFKITSDGLMSTFATGFPFNFFLSALAIDSAGNVFVGGGDTPNNYAPSTIYKVTPGGTVSPFAYTPVFNFLTIDSADHIYAATLDSNGNGEILEFDSNGTEVTYPLPNGGEPLCWTCRLPM
jgi:hypothetical protein